MEEKKETIEKGKKREGRKMGKRRGKGRKEQITKK